jgi:hypothetical protein
MGLQLGRSDTGQTRGSLCISIPLEIASEIKRNNLRLLLSLVVRFRVQQERQREIA